MQTLTVVNEMLGTMGEAPLNTLDDPHRLRGACLSTLDKLSRSIQAKGWWFNREPLTIAPSALSSECYVPGDTINTRYPSQHNMNSVRNIVQRGRRLYNLDTGDYVFDSAITVEIVRLIPFQDLPETAAQYIADMAVIQFQSKYDGDTRKTQELLARTQGAMGSFVAISTEETRNRRANMLESNSRLQRIKSFTRAARIQTR